MTSVRNCGWYRDWWCECCLVSQCRKLWVVQRLVMWVLFGESVSEAVGSTETGDLSVVWWVSVGSCGWYRDWWGECCLVSQCRKLWVVQRLVMWVLFGESVWEAVGGTETGDVSAVWWVSVGNCGWYRDWWCECCLVSQCRKLWMVQRLVLWVLFGESVSEARVVVLFGESVSESTD